MSPIQLRNEFKAGVFVIIALGLLAVSVFAIGRDRQLFIREVPFSTTFKDVMGLSAGAPVRLGGITIGRVEDVDFAPHSRDPNIIVDISINEKFADRLREDSTTSIETHGLLGDRFLNISTGQSPNPLKPHSELRSTAEGDVGQLFDKVKNVVNKGEGIADDVKGIASRLNDEGVPKVVEAAADVSALIKDVREGKGTLHSLIYGKETNILKTAQESMTAFREAALALKEVANEVKSGNGLLHQIIYNSAERPGHAPDATTIAEFQEAITNLKTITRSLVQGNGTLGALLIDPSLYNGLVEITDGAKRSFVLRQVVRQSLAQ